MRKGDKKRPEADFTSRRRYVNERELSKVINKAVAGLQLDRHKCQGLPYIKLGGKVLYDLIKVHQYLEDHTITPQG